MLSYARELSMPIVSYYLKWCLDKLNILFKIIVMASKVLQGILVVSN